MVFEHHNGGITLFRGLDGSYGAIAQNWKHNEDLPRTSVVDLDQEYYELGVEWLESKGVFPEDFLDYLEPR